MSTSQTASVLKRKPQPTVSNSDSSNHSHEAREERRKNIVAKNPWHKYDGVLANDPSFDKVMDSIEAERSSKSMSE